MSLNQSELFFDTKSIQKILKDKISNFKHAYYSEDIELSEIFNEIDAQEILKSIKLVLGSKYLYVYRNDITDPEYTHAKVQIGRFELDNDCNVINFIADADNNLTIETFSILEKSDFFSELKKRFNIVNPSEKNLEIARKLAYESNKKANEQQLEIDKINILAIKSSISNIRKWLDVEEDDLVGPIVQWEVGFVDEKSEKKYLETIGAWPCIIVTAYNADEKKIAMTHIDGLTDEELVLYQMINYAGKSELRVFGGNSSSINQLTSINKILSQREVNVVEWDILNSTKSIIINKETWGVFNVFNCKKRKDETKINGTTMFSRALQWKKPAKKRIF